MIIKYRNPTTIDVFFGIGWNNWAMFKISKKHGNLKCFQTQGIHINKKDLETLETILKSNQNE